MSNVNTIVSKLATIIPPVIAAPPSYPFVGKNAVKATLLANTEVQHLTLQLMYLLQTDEEQKAKDTEVRNRCGFMSSDAYTGSLLAEKLLLGMELEGEEVAKAERIATKYSKQLSQQLVRHACAQDARLAAYAITFSIKV
jgi:hypothetical protein